MAHTHSTSGRPKYDRIQCSDPNTTNSVIAFENVPIISGHWKIESSKWHKEAVYYMEKALRDCHHPLLEAWLDAKSKPGSKFEPHEVNNVTHLKSWIKGDAASRNP